MRCWLCCMGTREGEGEGEKERLRGAWGEILIFLGATYGGLARLAFWGHWWGLIT